MPDLRPNLLLASKTRASDLALIELEDLGHSAWLVSICSGQHIEADSLVSEKDQAMNISVTCNNGQKWLVADYRFVLP